MAAPVELVVVGAGERGRGYGDWVRRHPGAARVVGVAEPNPKRRQAFATAHGLAPEATFESWEGLATAARMADLAVVATQDRDHVEPALALIEKGYHLLLEKPMAPDLESCVRIAAAAEASGARIHVAHVLRHTAFTAAVRATIERGDIGDVMAIQRIEPLGFWHFAHSYVRGNWGNEGRSSPILLAKSCHDIDWIGHVVGRRCTRVSSFGSLVHFSRDSKPRAAGEATRCVACDHEPDCAWSAVRFYGGIAAMGWTGFPLTVLADDVDAPTIRRSLDDGPYGRCVYECDNDVPDTQSVLMEFEDGAQATFTLSAFTEARLRETRILGTEGELRGDGTSFEVFRFLDGATTKHTPNGPDADPRDLMGHGGGDEGLMAAVVADLAQPDPGPAREVLGEVVESHRVVFAAEQARREGRVVELAWSS